MAAIDVAVARPASLLSGDTAVAVPCTHCGLDVPPGLVDRDAPEQFCCAGCRAAYAIIHGHGLDRYYELPDRRTAPVLASARTYEEFDHASFHELYVRRGADGLAHTELYLENVHCAACVWLVERVPLLVAGVARAELNVRRALARVEWNPDAVPLSAIARALDALGYPPHPFRGVRADAMRQREDRALLVRIGIAGAIAGNVMLASFALYSGWFGGMDAEYSRFFRWLSLALTAPAVFGPGRIFFRGALGALRARALNMDVPIAIGLAAGLLRGTFNTFQDHGPVYFDAVATLTFLLLVGRYLQQRGQRAAADSAELLQSLAPATARLVTEEGVRIVPSPSLVPGMELEVLAGESLPADGVITGGSSSLDSSLLTGESRPASVAPGDVVYAGTINLAAPLRVRVSEAGESSRLARILRDVEEGATRRAPVVVLANRVAAWFVAAVLVLAAATFAFWYRHDPTAAIDNAIALLVVTCPCALALATPLAVSVAIGRAARSGILIRGGSTLEVLARPGRLFLDKTGTITEARTALRYWNGPAWVRPLVLAVEQDATHPVARGFHEAWADDAVPEATELATTLGAGIAGVVAGHRVVVGSPAHVRARAHGGDDMPAVPGDLTPVLVAVDDVVVGAAGFGDPIRTDAVESVSMLRARGWRISILSGDHPDVVTAVAQTLRLDPADCIGAASPEEKRRVIAAASLAGPVVMVGDGVNDAAAIAAASVGIGVHGGAEASLSTADVYLAEAGLAPLVRLVDGAARAFRIIRRNVLFALGYNAVGVTLAMTGHLDPLVAAILMPLASLTVVLTSWRSHTFAERAE